MNLQPPSFFEITPPQEDAKVERAILTKWREELARLNRENKLLKYVWSSCGNIFS